MNKCLSVLLGLTIMFLSIQSDLLAVGSGGIANEVTSSEQLAISGIAGSKTDPTVVYNNPASIGDLGKFMGSFGLTYYNFSVEREGANGTSDKMKTGNIIVPNFAVAGGLGEGKFGLGLAVVSPYGLETEWSGTSNVRYVATKSELKMVDITPAVSYRPSEKFAVGVGLDYFLTFDANLEKKVPVDVINALACASNALLCPGTSGAPDANSGLTGDGDQWGYHSGVLYNPSKGHTFGVAYHSEVKTKLEGEIEITGLSGTGANAIFGGANYKTPASIDLFYPQNVQLGYKHSRDNKWEAGISLAWYDWSANKQLEIVTPAATATQQSFIATPVPLHWRDVWSGTIGGFYRFSDTWKLNMGAYYVPHVYPESTFTPGVPDMNKIGLSVGPSYSKGSWSLDTVYNPLFYKTTNINNTRGQDSTGLAAADISGRYKAIIHIFGLTAKYHF